DEARIGGDDPAADLPALLPAGTRLAGRYEIEDEGELRRTLRRGARAPAGYRRPHLRSRETRRSGDSPSTPQDDLVPPRLVQRIDVQRGPGEPRFQLVE